MAVAARPQDVGKATGAGPSLEIPVAEVKAGKFGVTVVERGSLEASRNQAVQCQAEGQSTIISILPEGTKVKKGDMVAELDSASLRDQLTNQRIAIQAVEATYLNAKLTREIAELATKEYEEGTYLSDKFTIQGEIKLAESANQKAKARLERTRRARQKLTETLSRKEATTTSGDILVELDVDDRLDASEHAVLRETFSLEKAQTKLNLLDNYTKPKTVKELRTEVEKALSDELAKKQRWDLEKDKEAKLEKQINACRIFAPSEGVVIRANEPSLPGGPPAVDDGATVRERQVLMHILDLGGPMQVSAKVDESMNDRVRPGQRAQVEVDAFPVAVKKPDGGFEWREVGGGDTDGAVVEVKQGLRPGEQVALKFSELIREGMNREKNLEPTKPR